MPQSFDLDKACAELAAVDPVMAELIERLPAMQVSKRKEASTFAALLQAISGQQLSVKAAATIHGRLLDLFAERRPEPQTLLEFSVEELRAAGLSRNKVAAVQDLAAKCLDGTVPSLKELDDLDDEDIVQRLIQVRGIGRWTAEMLLIFQLARPNILPVDDLGVQRGYMVAYNKTKLPKPKDLARYGRAWAPYRSVASWYLWRAGEVVPKS